MGQNQFVEIGTIQRTHGINGELQIQWSDNINLSNEFPESVFIEIDGIPIPFFIASMRAKGVDKALIKFDDVDDIESASDLENLRLFLPEEDIEENQDLLFKDLIGYTIVSDQKQIIGTITDYQEYQSNSVFTVIHASKVELLIPATDELIVEINEETKTLVMQIPEGLLDLYLE
jgi:16S rRNA processing protein RimM